jgi:exodeoxyribonuclease-3
MRIATFNINGIRRRLGNLLAWLDEERPDVVALQELKASQEDFPAAELEQRGYTAVWKGQKSWNGVAILSRLGAPIMTRTELPGNTNDDQSRYIEAAVEGILIANLYLPNGNPQPGPKFTYKLAWFDRLIKHADALLETNLPVVLLGDFNVVPTTFDIYPSTSWDTNALVQPESRAAFQALLDMGWVDSVRTKHPKEPCYTFWDYMRKRWERDAGLRIDHLLLSPSLAPRLKDAGVSRDVRGVAGASDHAPAWIELGAVRKRPTRAPNAKSARS